MQAGKRVIPQSFQRTYALPCEEDRENEAGREETGGAAAGGGLGGSLESPTTPLSLPGMWARNPCSLGSLEVGLYLGSCNRSRPDSYFCNVLCHCDRKREINKSIIKD